MTTLLIIILLLIVVNQYITIRNLKYSIQQDTYDCFEVTNVKKHIVQFPNFLKLFNYSFEVIQTDGYEEYELHLKLTSEEQYLFFLDLFSKVNGNSIEFKSYKEDFTIENLDKHPLFKFASLKGCFVSTVATNYVIINFDYFQVID